MSQTSQREASWKQFMQEVYMSGFKLGAAEQPMEVCYHNKKVNNKYELGWKHGWDSNTG